MKPYLHTRDVQHKPSSGHWRRKTSEISLLMFVIGAASTLDFSLIGRVTLAEVIAFLCIPYFWLSSPVSLVNANFKKSVAILALMFVGTAIGDFINENILLFSARALARPVFMLGFLLFFIPVLVRDPLSLIYMVYGQVIAGFIKFYRPSDFESVGAVDLSSYEGAVFRVQPLIMAIAVASAVFIYARSRVLASLCFIGGAAGVMAIGGSRGSILIWAVSAAILLIVKWFKGKNSRRIELTKPRLILMAALLSFSLACVYVFYLWAAPRGILGETQQSKVMEQQNTVFGASPIGFVLAGRPQVYGAILGIMDRPIFGFGSWRHELTSPYVIDAIASVGTDPRILDLLSRGSSVGGAGHSVLFQSWVENGIIPAISLIMIFIITAKVFLFVIRYENRITPYFVFTFAVFTWGFLFSPPGIALRFTVGLFLAVYVVYMDKRRALSRVEVLSA